MKNTICEQCYFSNPASSDQPCVFNIPEIIKDTHELQIKDNYYILHNYSCRYGFGKKTYKENIDKFSNIDLIEYIKQQNMVAYSLALILEKDEDYNNAIDCINKLSIKPYYIAIICHNDGKNIHNLLQKNLTTTIKYKVHSFLDNTPSPKCLHIALETNKNNIGNLLWILNYKDLVYCIDNDSIQNINYLINAAQVPAHYYRLSATQSNFSGIFINQDNYWSLSRTLDYTIENNHQTLVTEYD